jgi:hypothetical protein
MSHIFLIKLTKRKNFTIIEMTVGIIHSSSDLLLCL